jgi:hypothetical protein
MISRRNVQQNTDRIARNLCNVVICRTFEWSVSSITTARGDGLIDRSRGYRPRIDNLEMNRFAGLSPR